MRVVLLSFCRMLCVHYATLYETKVDKGGKGEGEGSEGSEDDGGGEGGKGGEGGEGGEGYSANIPDGVVDC